MSAKDSASRDWLTADELEEYGIEEQEGLAYFWDKNRKMVLSITEDRKVRIVKRMDVSSEEQSERASAQRKMSKSEQKQARDLVEEDLGKSWDECSEREKVFAEKFVTGSSADRKVWVDYVVRRKGTASEEGIDVLPLSLDDATRVALIDALEVIQEIQRERHEQRLRIIEELSELEVESLGDLQPGEEDQDDCPF